MNEKINYLALKNKKRQHEDKNTEAMQLVDNAEIKGRLKRNANAFYFYQQNQSRRRESSIIRLIHSENGLPRNGSVTRNYSSEPK